MNLQQRGQFLRGLIGTIREQEFPYEPRPESKTRWRDYNLAQCREIVEMISLIRDLVDQAGKRLGISSPPMPSGPGRPPVNPLDIAKILLLQSYFGVSNRVASGLVLLFLEKLGLTSDFSYKTIERGYERKDVREILDEVFKLTNEPIEGLEKVFSVDGSGVPTSVKQNYANDRLRQNSKKSKGKRSKPTIKDENLGPDDDFAKSSPKKKHDYVYNLPIIGVKYKLFAAWNSTSDHTIGETTMFPQSMAQAYENHPEMETVLGDGIFATRPICEIVGKYNATPRFLPRRNVTLKRKGVREWSDMLWDLMNDPQSWLADYHMRSISETGFAMLAKSNPWPLKKRLDNRKETENYLRGIDHNIKRLCYLRFLEEIDPLPQKAGA